MRISYSSLDTFKTCPKKFEFQVIEKIKVPKTKEQVFGTSLHSTLKRFYDKSPSFPTLDELIDYFRLEWLANAEKVKWTNEKEKEVYFSEGKRILEDFYKKNIKQTSIIVALESSFEAPIEDEAHEAVHTLTGIIDRIDKIGEGKFEIIDYKTNRKMPAASILKDNLQLSIYTIGFLKRWPNLAKLENIDLSLYFLKHGEKLSTKRNQEDIEQTKNQILKNIGEIEKNYFPPIPSPLCNYCHFRPMCPMWSHLYQEVTPAEAEIKKLINEYFSLKDDSDKNDEQLALIKEDYDLDKIKKILEFNGFWPQVVSLDKKKLDSLLKKLPPNLLRQIEEAKTKTKTTKVLRAVKKSLERIKKELE